jgi:DNA-directed RNA polymerase subunit RPC12/RpoP
MEAGMKALCPRCGRTSVIDEDVGDFPLRCRRCGALVRRRGEAVIPADPGAPALPRTARIRRGTLAKLLTARSPSPKEERPVIHARSGAAVRSGPGEGRQGVLRPESRREVHRVRARHRLLRQAELKGSQRVLGALSWAGLAVALLLALGALVLKAQAAWP